MNPVFNFARRRTSRGASGKPTPVSRARLLATLLAILSGALLLGMLLGRVFGLEARDLERMLPGWPW
jgi:hypothetical protein